MLNAYADTYFNYMLFIMKKKDYFKMNSGHSDIASTKMFWLKKITQKAFPN